MGKNDTIWEPLERKGKVVGGDDTLELIIQGLLKDAQREVAKGEEPVKLDSLKPKKVEEELWLDTSALLVDQNGRGIEIDTELITINSKKYGSLSTRNLHKKPLHKKIENLLDSFYNSACIVNPTFNLTYIKQYQITPDIYTTQNQATYINSTVFGIVGEIHGGPDAKLKIVIFQQPGNNNIILYQQQRQNLNNWSTEIIGAGYFVRSKNGKIDSPILMPSNFPVGFFMKF